MRIAIVEDNKAQQILLKKFIEDFSKQNELQVTVTLFSDGLQIINNYEPFYDVIYLDIEMKYLDGMTSAKKIRVVDENVAIVFVTNHVQFAIDAYSVDAIDFLLKPLNFFAFSEHFKKIVAKINDRKAEKMISIKTNNGLRNIDISTLLYIESDGHYIHFHTLNCEFVVRETMKTMERKLVLFDFYRCNNSYLVNLRHVKGIQNNEVLIANSTLQISRSKKKEFLSVITNYLGQRI